MTHSKEERNKALVLEAFDTLFNRREYVVAERYWSPNYIQHSTHIAPGREGLFNLTKSLPPTLRYEPGLVLAEGDFVIAHGRFSGFGDDSFAFHGKSRRSKSAGRGRGFKWQGPAQSVGRRPFKPSIGG